MADYRVAHLRERAYAAHAQSLSVLEKDAGESTQHLAKRREKADSALKRDLALLDTRFSEAWKALIVAGTAPQYRANASAFGDCTFGGRVPRGEILGGSVPESFNGIDIQHAVLDTYDKLRLVGVPVAHIPGLGGLEIEADPSNKRFNAKVEHDLPECNGEEFEVIGYQVMIDDEGSTLRFSVRVWWKSKVIQHAEDDRFSLGCVQGPD